MTPTDAHDLAGHEVVVGVCGGIAAYKVCHVVSSLVQRDAGVTVVMTEAATRFVTPTTFGALSGREVFTTLWCGAAARDPQHIRLTRDAGVFLIAPATANVIGKIAHGICDDLLTTMITAAECPIVLAPAMNDAMWRNPAVRANVGTLEGFGYHLVGPAEGWLACRSVGPGRMVEPERIVQTVVQTLLSNPDADRGAADG